MLTELAQIGPNPTTKPFWDACARRELSLQRCRGCGRFRQPPSTGCPHCASTESDWPVLSGRGEIYSYTIIHHPALPALKQDVPYNVVVVAFADAPGARLISNLIGEPDRIRIGLPVEVVWDEVRPDLVLPRFRAIG